MYKTVVFLGYNIELVVSYKDVQRLKDLVRKRLPGGNSPGVAQSAIHNNSLCEEYTLTGLSVVCPYRGKIRNVSIL